MKIKNYLFLGTVFLFLFCLITRPEICKDGAIRGILLSSRVIIPSLFPFTVCILILQSMEFFEVLRFLTPVTKRFFSLTAGEFSLFLLSLLGGYPVGAKLLNEAEIDNKKAGIMLNYCVNAGPAFIISAVGFGILGSEKIGYILLSGHILSAIFLSIAFKFFMPPKTEENKKKKPLNLADSFVLSTAKASETVLSICAFVILFSTINAYIESFSIKPLLYILEVTNAVAQTKNIYLISFLLGFAGVSVWCQVIFSAKRIRINFPIFLLSRIIHGALSSLFTFAFVRLSGISVATFSNGKVIFKELFYSTAQLGVSMLVMVIIFIISLQSKKYAGKIIEDMI